MTLRDKFHEMVNYINNNFIAEIYRNVYNPSEDLELILSDGDSNNFMPITTVLTLLNSCVGNNTLIEGGSGQGKTKLAGVVSSMLFQIPHNLYESNRVSGTPGATVNEIYATHDIAELNRGNDVAFLYWPFNFPLLTIDEINRYSELEQNRIREGVASDVWSYAGHSWKIQGQVVISAINPQVYGGTFMLNENLRDNFSIVLEPPLFNPIAHENLVVNAESNIKQELSLDDDNINKIINNYQNYKNDPKEVGKKINKLQEQMANKLKEDGLLFIHNGELKDIKLKVEHIHFSPEANLFKYSLLSEMTYSDEFGRLRLEDPKSINSHDEEYLSGLLREGLAGRFLKDWLTTSQMISWYVGKPEVGVEELRAGFIYSAAHRLKPTQEFYQSVINGRRELPVNFELARQVADKAWANYSSFSESNKGINMARKAIRILNDEDGNIKEAIKILKNVDHPIGKSLLKAIAEHQWRG